MMIYLFIFFISTIFAFLYSKSQKKFPKILFAILTVIIPSILAGLRAEGIGTDTIFYVKRVFSAALVSNNFSLLHSRTAVEIGYAFINYIVSRYTTNINILYFLLQLIIQFFVFKACSYAEKEYKCPLWLSYLAFLLLYYNRSLNMVRQSISIAIVLYSYKYIKDKSYVKVLLLFLLALSFHNSVIIGIPIILIIMLSNSKISSTIKIVISMLTFLIIFLFMCYYNQIISFLTSNGIIDSRYTFYASSDSTGNVILIDYVFKAMIFLITVLLYKLLKKNTNCTDFIYFIWIEFLLYHLAFFVPYTQRLSYYFGYFNIFVISQISKCFKGTSSRIIVNSLVIVFMLAFWYLYYVYLGADATVPYMSILNY